MKKVIILTIVLLFFNVLVVMAQDRFSESQCVTRLTKELDPPFRLKSATAVKRCKAVALRIETLSKQILGKWQLVDSKGRKETLEFFAEGTVRRDWYDSTTRKSRRDVEKWAITNRWGEVGEETIEFNDGFGVQWIKISGATMTITTAQNNPRFDPVVERYKRISQEASTISFSKFIDPYLNKNYPGWKVTSEADLCSEEFSKSFINGDFNGDGKEDYALKFVQGRKGYITAFLETGNSYSSHILINTSANDIKSTGLNIAKKGERYPVGGEYPDYRYGRLPNDAPLIGPCASHAKHYVYRNGRFY